MPSDAPLYASELEKAQQALNAGSIQDAEALCTQLLARAPGYAPALHLNSMLLFRQGQIIPAIAQLMQALEREPEHASWLNDLGNLLAAHGSADQAIKFFQHALLLEPDNAQIWNNLGAMRVKQGEAELAGEAFERAVALDENLVDAWVNYANWLNDQGREQDAAECVLRAFVAAPDEGQALLMRAMALARLGRQSEAASCYRRHLAHNPNDPIALHLYHACTKETVPARASNAYIQLKYQDYADNFEQHQSEMGYRGSAMVAQKVAELCGEQLTALDAGCGTGLLGRLLRAQCQRLIGVDLSEHMLELARQTTRYHALEQAEILDYLSQRQGEYDLVTAADLLIYFGSLKPFLQHALIALRPGGYLVATVEALQATADAPYEIQPNGRFRHQAEYVSQLMTELGYQQIELTPEILRVEGGEELRCWLLSAHRPGH